MHFYPFCCFPSPSSQCSLKRSLNPDEQSANKVFPLQRVKTSGMPEGDQPFEVQSEISNMRSDFGSLA